MHANLYAFAVSTAGTAPAMPATTHSDYLVYRAAGRQHGVALHNVLELRRFDEVSGRGAPGHAFAGTITVQGVDVPVVDLSAMIGSPLQEHDINAEVVVLAVAGRTIAIAAECVIDVVTLDPEQIRSGAAMRAEDAENYLHAIGKIGQRVLGLLDVDRLIRDLQPKKFAA